MQASLLDQAGAIYCPGDVLWKVDAQEFEAGQKLQLSSIDADGLVDESLPSEVNDELLVS